MIEVKAWVEAHPWFVLLTLALLWVLSLKVGIQRIVRAEVRAEVKKSESTFEYLTSKSNDELEEATRDHLASLRHNRDTIIGELRSHRESVRAQLSADVVTAMREMLITARKDGIPIVVRVTSKKEADLIRETIGPVPIKVTAKKDSPIAPPPPDPSTLSALERLAGDDDL